MAEKWRNRQITANQGEGRETEREGGGGQGG